MSGVADLDVKCGECGAPMVLRPSRFGLFYGCSTYPICKGTHGAHPDGKPLGIPANKATKEARMRAHDAFDKIWQSGMVDRKGAYAMMRRELGFTDDTGHIGRFTIEECERLVKWAEEGMQRR